MTDVRQLCLDVSKAAMELFDLVDEKGDHAPLDDTGNVMILQAMLEPMYEIKGYYTRLAVQRMLALGVSPANIIKSYESAGPHA
jgi:hypothetical protein